MPGASLTVRMTPVSQPIPERIVQYGSEWQVFGRWHNPVNRSGSGAGLKGNPRDADKHHPFSWCTHPGVNSAPRLVNALNGSDEPLNCVGRARKGLPPEGREQVPTSLLRLHAPRLEATRVGALFPR